ncbi:MAG: hypothetical protein JWQ76_1982 [Ramlibacter sp.]|nr:hypothetical protein [Ramlibacter sp.]
MNKTTILCAVLAGTFGFGTLASAQDGQMSPQEIQRLRAANNHIIQQQERDARSGDNQLYEQRGYNRPQAEQRSYNQQRGYANGQQRGYVQNQPRYGYNQPQYGYDQPQYSYNQPRYYNQAPRYQRGGYLPRQYLSSNYYVNNWQAYPGLYAPPYGYQWVDTGGDFVLAALATGLIVNLLAH